MHSHSGIAAALAVFASASVFASPVWDFDGYGDASYPEWSAAEDNLLLGMRPTAYYNAGAEGVEATNPDTITLTDGVLPATYPDKSTRYTIGSYNAHSWFEYTFDTPVHIGEFRLYTYWGNNDRNDISIESIQVKTTTSGDTWTTLNNSAVLWGHNRQSANAPSGGNYIGRRARLYDPDTLLLAPGVTAFKVTFGNQDNGHGGHIEMELVPAAAFPLPLMFPVGNTWETLAWDGTMASVGLGGTTADVYFAFGTDPDNLPAPTLVQSGLEQGDTFQITASNLSLGTTYYYSITCENDQGSRSSAQTGSFTTLLDADHGRKFSDGIITHSDLYINHTFATAGTYSFTPDADVTADLLLVGGGGAGGWTIGGGGGGGGVVQTNSVLLRGGTTYTLTVGAGGDASKNHGWVRGGDGNPSSFGDIVTALGGGGGAQWNEGTGRNGANGGGGAHNGLGGIATVAGGFGGGAAGGDAPGGGGGAGGPGLAGVHNGACGDGGPGLLSDFTGTPTYYAGGGGGGAGNSGLYAGAGGLGGGGAGGAKDSNVGGEDGTNGLGGGGGGGSYWDATPGGNGGCGCVIVRYFNAYAHAADTVPIFDCLGIVETAPTLFHLRLSLLGDNASSCNIYAAYGASADALASTNLIATATAPGDFDAELDGLTPGDTYIVQLIAVNDQGVSVALAPVSVWAAGASEIADGLTVDITHQRTIGVTGALEVLGAGDTVVQLLVDGVPVADQVLTSTGPFSLTWDGTSDQTALDGVTVVPAAVFGQTYTVGVVCTNAFRGQVWTDTSAEVSFVCSDAATYTWTGLGADRNWTNPDNWSGAPANGDGLGYPILGSTVSFPGGTQCDVFLDTNVTVRTISFNGGNAANHTVVTISGTSTNDCVLHVEHADPLIGNGGVGWGQYVDFTLDNAATIWTFGGWYTLEGNNSYTFTNGAYLYHNGLWFVNRANTRLTVSDEAWLELSSSLVIGGGTVAVVDDATIRLGEGFYPNQNSADARFIFRGTHPRVLLEREFSCWEGANPANLYFEVPVGGYDEPPIELLTVRSFWGTPPMGGQRDGHNSAGNLIFNIDPDSPAGTTGDKLTTTLVYFKYDYVDEVFDFTSGERPDPAIDFIDFEYNEYGQRHWIVATLYGTADTPVAEGVPAVTDFEMASVARYSGVASARICPNGSGATWTASWSVGGNVLGTANGTVGGEPEVVTFPVDNLPGGAAVTVSLSVVNAADSTCAETLAFTLPADQEALVQTASGAGVIKTTHGTYDIYVFSDPSAAGTVEIARGGFADLLLVGGGGGGGCNLGTGGGAGGFVYKPETYLAAGTYTMQVGAGGVGSSSEWDVGGQGGNTTFADLFTAFGGGGGSSYNARTASTGASGGGANFEGAPGLGIVGQGHPGGTCLVVVGGGGGGAGAPGQSGSDNYADGDDFAAYGGDGLPCAITGEALYYAGGGGSGAGDIGWWGNYRNIATQGGRGGRGGGGNGGVVGGSGQPGADGFGGGGGGGASNNGHGGNGGNGTVVLRVYTGTLDDPNPVVVAGGVSGLTNTCATLDWSLLRLGAGASAVSIALEYGTAPDRLDKTLAIAGGLAEPCEGSFTTASLSCGTHYYARLVATGDQTPDPGVYATPLFEFDTMQETDDSAPPSYTGLWQVKVSGNGCDWVTDPLASPEGAGEYARHRELGPVMAFVTGAYTSELDSSIVSVWANNTTFLYAGYIRLEGGVAYQFRTRIDDTALLVIDGTTVVSAPQYTNPANGTYTPVVSGWFPVDIRVGDFGGNSGAIQGNDSFCYSTNGGASWTKLVDPGDGSLFRIAMPPALELVGLQKNGGDLRATLSIPADLAGATLTACYGETYGGADTAAWTTVSLGVLQSGETVRVEDLAVPAGTRFLRFVAEKNGAFSWTDTASLDDYADSDLDAPAVSLSSATADTFHSARIDAALSSAGAGCTVADITIAYGPEVGTTFYTNTWRNVQIGSAALVLDGLLPSHTYFAVLWAENARGARSEISGSFSFTTPALVESWEVGDPGVSLPGLWQGSIQGNGHNFDKAFDPLEAEDVHRELGAVMAQTRNGAAGHWSSLDGVEWHSIWSPPQTYAYSGAMWMEAGVPYVFAGYFDDHSYVTIEGSVIVDSGNVFCGWSNGSYTPSRTGWHAIGVRVGDNGGEAKPCGNFAIGIGFATNINVIAAMNGNATSSEGWVPLIDPGDGSLLRTAAFLRTIALDSFQIDGGVFTPTLAFGECRGGDTGVLHACYGAAYGGNDPTDWETDAVCGTLIAPQTMSHTWENLFSGAGSAVKYVRFYIAPLGSSAITWSDTFVLPDPNTPAFDGGLAVDAHAGDALAVSGRLSSVGAGPTAAVTVDVATRPDFSDAVAWSIGDTAASTPFAATLFTNDLASAYYLRPGSTYYVRATATAAGGLFDRTAPVQVTMPAGSVLASGVSSAVSMWTITFSGELTTYGAGDGTTIHLLTGPDADHLEPAGSIVATEAGPFSFTVTYPDLNHTVYYAFESTNECSTAAWSSRSSVATAATTDQASYYWKGDVQTGAWNDATNWDTVPDDPRLTYPDSASAKVYFTRCTSGEPYVVAVTGSYDVAVLAVAVPDADITFRGEAGVSRIQASLSFDGNNPGFPVAAGETVTFDGVYFYTADFIRTAAGTTLRVLNGGSLLSNREMWIEGADSLVEARGGSTVGTTGWGVDLYGPRARIVIDDSTLQSPGNLVHLATHSGAVGNVVELFGDHPRIYTRDLSSAYDQGCDMSTIDVPVLLFHVPENGYAEAPVQRSSENYVLNTTDRFDIRIVIAKDSPLFRTGHVREVPLIAWTPGILASRFDTADQPRPALTRVYWTYGASASTTPDGANPTGLWAHLDGTGATVLLFR